MQNARHSVFIVLVVATLMVAGGCTHLDVEGATYASSGYDAGDGGCDGGDAGCDGGDAGEDAGEDAGDAGYCVLPEPNTERGGDGSGGGGSDYTYHTYEYHYGSYTDDTGSYRSYYFFWEPSEDVHYYYVYDDYGSDVFAYPHLDMWHVDEGALNAAAHGLAVGDPATDMLRLEEHGVSHLLVPGDVDGDGQLTSSDRASMASAVSGWSGGLYCQRAGDVDGDGYISADDVAIVDQILGAYGTLGGTPLHPLMHTGGSLPCALGSGVASAQEAEPGASVPLLVLSQHWGVPADVRVLAGPGSVRRVDSETFAIDIAETAVPDSDFVELEVRIPGRHAYTVTVWVDMRDTASAAAASASAGSTGGSSGSTSTAGAEVCDCPHRGAGCCALYLDFNTESNPWYYRTDLRSPLANMGCTVSSFRAKDYNLRPMPRAVDVVQYTGSSVIRFTIPPAAHRLDQWRADVAIARRALDAAVDAHRMCVNAGTEAAYEIISGHGSDPDRDYPMFNCGDWGPYFYWSLFPRRTFIQDSYDAARGSTCGWTMVDASCHSGLSTVAAAQANNTGTADCPVGYADPGDVHDHHAGWESDLALASALPPNLAHAGSCASDLRSFRSSMDRARINGTVRAYDHVVLNDFPSYYDDLGSAVCRGTRYVVGP